VKHLDEYRDPERARALLAAIRDAVRKPWTLMEVCGGQTHAILRFGLDQLLPASLDLIHGPGCPVCVTSLTTIDRALLIAAQPDVIFCSFGDMLRVPGSFHDLLSVKARGGDVRMVYSPLDALELARAHRERRVVFFAVGFETTAPAAALAVLQAEREGLSNFFLLVAHVLVPPALETILDEPERRVQALLAPGHVCAVAGTGDYRRLAERYRVPIVVTGFEPVDILQGVLGAVRQLEAGEAGLENAYARAVPAEGNRHAQAALGRVFVPVDRDWRGLGVIPTSGYALAPAYERFDAERVFEIPTTEARPAEACRSGLVLQGRLRPFECPEFGTGCTPEHPLGATMVSSEGACAAYYRYGRTGPASASGE